MEGVEGEARERTNMDTTLKKHCVYVCVYAEGFPASRKNLICPGVAKLIREMGGQTVFLMEWWW